MASPAPCGRRPSKIDGLDGHDLVLVQRQRVPDVHLQLHDDPKLGRRAEQAPQTKAHLRAQVPLLAVGYVAGQCIS